VRARVCVCVWVPHMFRTSNGYPARRPLAFHHYVLVFILAIDSELVARGSGSSLLTPPSVFSPRGCPLVAGCWVREIPSQKSFECPRGAAKTEDHVPARVLPCTMCQLACCRAPCVSSCAAVHHVSARVLPCTMCQLVCCRAPCVSSRAAVPAVGDSVLAHCSCYTAAYFNGTIETRNSA
jgi:hypothetical protein